jgi:hypothetical protein
VEALASVEPVQEDLGGLVQNLNEPGIVDLWCQNSPLTVNIFRDGISSGFISAATGFGCRWFRYLICRATRSGKLTSWGGLSEREVRILVTSK